MKLLIVTRSIPEHSDAGGMEGVAWDLAKELSLGSEVHVLTTSVPGRGEHFVLDGLQVETIPGTKPGRYSAIWWIKSALWRQVSEYDSVLSVSAGASSMARFNRSARYVFQAHGTAFSELQAILAGKPRLWVLKALRMAYWDVVDRGTYRIVDAVVPVSTIVGEKLQHARYSRARKRTKFTVIPNGVKPNRAEAAKGANRLRFGLNASDAVLVSVSRLVRQKGVDHTIAALTLCNANTKLLVVGDGPEAENLRQQASQAGLADRVVFTGHLDKSGVREALEAADAFVFPVRNAQREGLPLAVLEAISCGLPVIVPQESAWDAELSTCLRFTNVADPQKLAVEMSAAISAERVVLPASFTHQSMVSNYKKILGVC